MWGSTNAKGVPESETVAQAASDGWYNGELKLFPAGDFGKDTPDMSNFSKWGHFSQLVWKGTKQVGCATHFCAAGTLSSLDSWYTVCNYFPAGMCFLEMIYSCSWANPRSTGNMGGAYGANVAPSLGQATVSA